MDGGNEGRVLQQAIGVLRNILASPETVTSLSSSVVQQATGDVARVAHSSVESEMRELFSPGSSQVGFAEQAATQGQDAGLRQSLRYQTQKHFGNWRSRSRKRAQTHHNTFNKDVVLLPKPSSSAVVKHQTKQWLHEQGHILNGFEFQKSWKQMIVTEQIREAFGEKLSADISLEFLMASGNRLTVPKLRAGQELNGELIHKIYKSKALYVRPSKPILDDITGNSSEDNECEEDNGSGRQLRSSSQKQDGSSDLLTGPAAVSPPNCSPAVQPTDSPFGCGAILTETPSLMYSSIMLHKHESMSSCSWEQFLPLPQVPIPFHQLYSLLNLQLSFFTQSKMQEPPLNFPLQTPVSTV